MIVNLVNYPTTTSGGNTGGGIDLDGAPGQSVGFDTNHNARVVDIGGTNMVRNTAILSTEDWKITKDTGTAEVRDADKAPHIAITKMASFDSCESEAKIAQSNVPFAEDKEYTLSCYARGNGTLQIAITSSSVVHVINHEDWQHYIFIVTTKATDVDGEASFGVSSCQNLDICGIKVEVGGISTDWSLSPSDTSDVEFELISDSEIESLFS